MSSTFCLNCGMPRAGSFRYCRRCQYDFDSVNPSEGAGPPPDSAEPSAAPPAWRQPPARLAERGVAPPTGHRRNGRDWGARLDVVLIAIAFTAIGIAVPVGIAMWSGAPLFGWTTVSEPAGPSRAPTGPGLAQSPGAAGGPGGPSANPTPTVKPTPKPTPKPTADTKRPTISGRTPGRNAVNVATSSTVRVVFSEPVRNVSASTIRLVNVGGGWAVHATVRYDGATRTATLTPNLRMYDNTQYRVEILPGITDLARNRLASTSWTFRTGSR